MQRWEYAVATSNTEQQAIEEECESFGRNGWELVSVIAVEATPEEWRTRMIFKRPQSDSTA